MRGYSSRYLKEEDMQADPGYRQRLREFMQEINPKPEHVIAALEEIKVSKKRDLVVYATDSNGNVVAHANVWASDIPEALSKAGEVLPRNLQADVNIAVCSKEAFKDAKAIVNH